MEVLNDYDLDSVDHIAIVGMTGRFPGAKNLDEFWQNLRDGVESITFFTAEELAGSNIDRSLLDNPQYVGADGVIEDMDMFDAEFFNIPPSVAELMDPQHRLFLECAWEVMEQAGYDSDSYDGRVAVYGGANFSTYLARNVMSRPDLRDKATSFQTMITNDKDFIATRVSYIMNLTGPSMTVATLCSSSFVAVHLACQALLSYRCDLALAGAISLQASRNEAFFYQEGGIGDPIGHCRAFDAKAAGTVSGSGVGLVALRRLEDALADGDTIHAVIRGTAVNNDGAIKYSYTAPSVEGQAKVIAEAMSLAEVHPETITYVETHGTGTHLGDPIEVAALTKAFRGNGAQKNQYCAIGSVKTNIGHLVNAGGVASLIKTVLAMQHRQIPASLNFEEPNPEIDFAGSPFYVNAKLADWETNGFPLRAGVSSFGIGGTNVHVVVEEAPEIEPSGKSRPWQLLVLSAKTNTALEKQTSNLIEYLERHPDANLADVAFTLQVGRRGFAHRRRLLCCDVQDAIDALKEKDSGRVLTRFQETKNRPVEFIFSGVDGQSIDAGLDLYQNEPAFRDRIEACTEAFEPALGIDLRRVLYPGAEEAGQAGQYREQSVVARAAVFALEYALAHLWMAWGIEPEAMIGDGVGEYVAACLAGVFSLEDAAALVAGEGKVERNGLSAPRIPFISGISGDWITEGEATSRDYWNGSRERMPPFIERLKPLLQESERVLLDLGPGDGLYIPVMGHPDKAERQVVLSSLSHQRGDQTDTECMLATLGDLWLAGVHVDWHGFHARERRRRLPLPTYPFERKRYWIEPDTSARQASLMDVVQPGMIVKKVDIADWFYTPVWKTSLLPRAGDFAKDEGGWLLFVDGCGVGSAMAEQLRRAGQRVVTVVPGDEFSRGAEDAYMLDVCQHVDYTTLFEELETSGGLPRRIVHLWSVTAEESGRSDVERFGQAQDRGFHSLLFLAQALAERTLDDTRLWVVSSHVQKVESTDVIYPERATILGLCKVIPQENAQVTCRHVDVSLPAGDAQTNGLGQQLLAEIGASLPDVAVAYRGRHRWVQVFEPAQLAAGGEPVRPLRENGVYLITSGLSDISLSLAEYLAQTVHARLVVVEGETFPRREQWEQWLRNNDPVDSVSFKIQNVRSLEDAGAELLVINADLTDVAQMQDVLVQVTARFGDLHGIIHAVGDMGDDSTFKTILDMGDARGIRPFEFRMRALFVLEEILSGRELDFCLLVSSLASVLGGVGQAAYAAANLFLDAFVASRGAPWLSINWDAWKFETERQHIAALTPRLAQFAISLAEGREAFERILSSHTGDQIVVSTGDLKARMNHWLMGAGPLQAQEQIEGRVQRHPRPQLLTPYVAPTTEIEETLVNVWQDTLGIESIGIDDNFFELGGDSLIAVRTITLLKQRLKTAIPTANLYQTPSVRALAELLGQDKVQATQQRATKLTERQAELRRRNARFRQRRGG
jgi:acyl transferase domain-containing protein/acyl carrier protein